MPSKGLGKSWKPGPKPVSKILPRIDHLVVPESPPADPLNQRDVQHEQHEAEGRHHDSPVPQDASPWLAHSKPIPRKGHEHSQQHGSTSRLGKARGNAEQGSSGGNPWSSPHRHD